MHPISLHTDPPRDLFAQLQAELASGLSDHARPKVPRPGFRPIAASHREPDGRLVGGLTGLVNWNWLHVQLLWVRPSRRGQGWGVALMEAVEAEGVRQGCRFAHLDTFSFQARSFYEALGYEVFGELPDYPPGQSRFFLRKTLGPESDPRRP